MFLNFNSESILTLPTLKESVCKDYERLAGPLREDFDEGEIERIYRVNHVFKLISNKKKITNFRMIFRFCVICHRLISISAL